MKNNSNNSNNSNNFNKNLEYIFLNKEINEIRIKESSNNIILINQNKTQKLKIYIEENSEVELLEIIDFQNEENEDKEYKLTREVIIDQNSKLIYNKIQVLDSFSNLEYDFNSFLEESSSLSINLFDFGSKQAISKFNSILKNKKAKLTISALVKTKNKSEVSNLIHIIHENQNTFSSLDFKHILDDSSKVHFEALSKITKDALFSEAYQSSNTILLSNDAIIYANPHLEIETNELKASHGATTGSLNEEELFYLQQRGLSLKKATNILLKAIESKIYDKISNQELKKLILDLYKDFNV